MDLQLTVTGNWIKPRFLKENACPEEKGVYQKGVSIFEEADAVLR